MNDAVDSDSFTKAQALLKNGQLVAGAQQLIHFLKTQPENLDALQLIAHISSILVDKNQSIALLDTCIKEGIISHILFYELGSSFLSLGKYTEAIGALQLALTYNPQSFEALHDMGAAYALLGDKTNALNSFLKAVSINDQSADLFYNLGRLYDDQFEFDRAINFYEKAVKIDRQYTKAWINLAIDLSAYKKYDQALTCFEIAYSQNPQVDFLYGDCVYTRMRMCTWENMSSIESRLRTAIQDGRKVISPFPISALLDSPEINQKAAILYANSKYPSNSLLGSISKNLNQKLRVGYFSPDFHEHPVSYLMAEVFDLHDRNLFEIYAFSFGKETNDEMRQRLRSSFDQFIDVTNKTPEEIARLSRDMGIDIAIDLCGFTENARTEIFSLRAAPIQMSYIGFLGTMGAPEYFDYLIADEVIIPAHLRQFYSEKIIYLPSYQANDSKRALSARTFSKADFGIEENQFVFCNLNNIFKITESIFNRWLNILSKTPNSVMMLYAENIDATRNLTQYAIQKNIDPNRLIFVERLPRSEYLARYKVTDLFLDTAPYNAGATASDALWMNIPIITLQGQSFASRVASSLLINLDLPELIHPSLTSYEHQAIELATQPAKLSAIKHKLNANKLTAPLFNTAFFVKNLEKAFAQAHFQYINNLPVKDIVINAQSK